MQTTSHILQDGKRRLAEAGIASALIDAELLLAHIIGCPRLELHLKRDRVLTADEVIRFEEAISKREQGAPVDAITGRKPFWNQEIIVTPDVLTPRPETEHVVERALEILASLDTTSRSHDSAISPSHHLTISRVLDLCTGSGCIAAALAAELPDVQFTVTDISEKALAVARQNLAFAKDRISFFHGDLFEAISRDHESTRPRTFDLITANPPYIPASDIATLPREVRKHDPLPALDGGISGLDFIARIVKDAPAWLRKGGWLIMEVGIGQAQEAKRIADETAHYNDSVITQDLAGIDRVISLRAS